MSNRNRSWSRNSLLSLLVLIAAISVGWSNPVVDNALDTKVKKFLADSRYGWRDMNVPAVDGQTMYDIIVKNGYKRALEIGTSTGHSGIWIAWALSKTGGKLITIEIDERRYRTALANFEAAGLSEYIDARLDDAHRLVKELPGPFDFVFSDADKNWYKNYFIDVEPKLEVGGCYATHNISRSRYRRGGGSGGYLAYLESLPHMETSLSSEGRSSLCISYKRSERKDELIIQ